MIKLNKDSIAKVGDWLLIGGDTVGVVATVGTQHVAVIVIEDRPNRWHEPVWMKDVDEIGVSGQRFTVGELVDSDYYEVSKLAPQEAIHRLAGYSWAMDDDDFVCDVDFARYDYVFAYAGVALCVDPGTRRCHYRYRTSPDVEFDFDLLCEVGEPWQPSFRKLIAQYGLDIELYDNGSEFYERLAK